MHGLQSADAGQPGPLLLPLRCTWHAEAACRLPARACMSMQRARAHDRGRGRPRSPRLPVTCSASWRRAAAASARPASASARAAASCAATCRPAASSSRDSTTASASACLHSSKRPSQAARGVSAGANRACCRELAGARPSRRIPAQDRRHLCCCPCRWQVGQLRRGPVPDEAGGVPKTHDAAHARMQRSPPMPLLIVGPVLGGPHAQAHRLGDQARGRQVLLQAKQLLGLRGGVCSGRACGRAQRVVSSRPGGRAEHVGSFRLRPSSFMSWTWLCLDTGCALPFLRLHAAPSMPRGAAHAAARVGKAGAACLARARWSLRAQREQRAQQAPRPPPSCLPAPGPPAKGGFACSAGDIQRVTAAQRRAPRAAQVGEWVGRAGAGGQLWARTMRLQSAHCVRWQGMHT